MIFSFYWLRLDSWEYHMVVEMIYSFYRLRGLRGCLLYWLISGGELLYTNFLRRFNQLLDINALMWWIRFKLSWFVLKVCYLISELPALCVCLVWPTWGRQHTLPLEHSCIGKPKRGLLKGVFRRWQFRGFVISRVGFELALGATTGLRTVDVKMYPYLYLSWDPWVTTEHQSTRPSVWVSIPQQRPLLTYSLRSNDITDCLSEICSLSGP